MNPTLTRALAAKREARPDAAIARYTAAMASHAAAGIETAREAAAARARGDHLMAATMEAIHANLAPVHTGHHRLMIELNGKQRFTPLSGSPATIGMAIKYKISDVNRIIRELTA